MTKVSVKVLASILFIVAIVGGVAIGVNYYPNLPELVSEKINSIITGKPPIGNLSVARDLKGTWVSSLKGKGIQLFGKFSTGPGTTSIYESGDVELVIKEVSNNVATGTIKYTNLCTWGSTTIPSLPTISIPKQCVSHTGTNPISIRVSGTKLDFGTIKSKEATFTMQGSYTTDIISGTTTTTLPSYGVIKGTFNLMRKK